MKKLYALFTGLSLLAGANAAEYSTNFENSVSADFLNPDVFHVGQNGSDLVIVSQGHDEWDAVSYYLNDGTDTVNVSLTKMDTIYVRAKADFTGTVNPVLGFQIFDENGERPNNAEFNAQSGMTLTSEYQVFKITVPNWNNTYGGGANTDSTKLNRIDFALNNGFGTYPFQNGEGETVNTAFNGTVYIDYVSIGEDLTAGTELDVLTSYSYTFDANTVDNVTAAQSFEVEVVNEALKITSAGHDEWEIVNLKIPNAVVDIRDDVQLSFTASVTPATGYTGPIGFMIALVDEVGTRIDYDGLFTYQDLSTTGEKITIDIEQYINQGDFTIEANEHRIASFDILINHGFVSFPPKNDAGVAVNEAFEGVITISDITLKAEALGLSFGNKNNAFEVFPNPVATSFVIDLDLNDWSNYTIANTLGSEVLTGTLDGGAVNVSSLNSGLYVLTISNGSETRSTTILKN